VGDPVNPLDRWRNAVQRNDRIKEETATTATTDWTQAMDDDERLPDGATITKDGNRVTLTVELPADVVLDSVSLWAIRNHLADAAAWVVYVPKRQREIDRGE
jgi:hypothetical protein